MKKEIAAETTLRAFRQVCIIPYLLILSLGCGIAVALLSFRDEWIDVWNAEL